MHKIASNILILILIQRKMQKSLTLRQAIDHFRPEFADHDSKLWQIEHGINYFRTIPKDIVVHYILPACGHLRQTYSRSHLDRLVTEYEDFLNCYQLLDENGQSKSRNGLPRISRTMIEEMGALLRDDAEYVKLKIYGSRINELFLNNTPISMCKYIGNSHKIAYDLRADAWIVYGGSTDYPMPEYHYLSIWILPCGLIFAIVIDNQGGCKSHNFVIEIPTKRVANDDNPEDSESREYSVKYVEVTDIMIRLDMEITHLMDDFGNIFAADIPETALMLSEICSVPAKFAL